MKEDFKLLPKNSFDHLEKKHPCFSGEAHFKYGRIHLPVSPACNIQCKFCKRSFNKYEKRPGVSHGILTPEEALKTVEKALLLCPDISVVGIAGPGDTLATTHALNTFELIDKKFPNLIKCLSTNGLKLEENVERIYEVGVRTISVTVNAVDPDILAQICSDVIIGGQHLKGREAANLLISKQLVGIKKAADKGIIVKVNAVLIPGVNDNHIEEIAKLTSKLGASILNIIPLIPQHEMIDLNAPSCELLDSTRVLAEKHLNVFRHCKQCRADACGVPGSGKDFARELYGEPIEDTFSHG